MADSATPEDSLVKLRELVAQLPTGLRADWQYTNHYELTATGEEFWWLNVLDLGDPGDTDIQGTEGGQRLGLILDIAAELGRLRDAGLFPPQVSA